MKAATHAIEKRVNCDIDCRLDADVVSINVKVRRNKVIVAARVSAPRISRDLFEFSSVDFDLLSSFFLSLGGSTY
jgi:hypothetical protein